MELIRLLDERELAVLTDAAEAMKRAHLRHYEQAGAEAIHARLRALYEAMRECVRTRHLGPIETHECVSDGGVPHHDEATDHGIKDAHPTSSTAAAGEPVGALTLRVAELDLLRDIAMGDVREGRPQRNVAAGFNAQWNLQRMHGGFLG